MKRPDALTLVAFAGVIVLAGGNAVGIAFSNAELAPFWGAFLRFSAAALVFFAIALGTRRAFPRGRALGGVLAYGMFGFFAFYALVYWGIQFVSPGLAQTLLALAPLFTLLLAVGVGQERFRWASLGGTLLSLLGIVVIFREQISAAVAIAGLVAVLGAAGCFAIANVALKSTPRADIVATNAVALMLGAVLLFVLSFVANESHVLPREAPTWRALLYLIVFGTVAVFWLFLFVLQRWTASAVSYQFVLLPLVTFPLSAWLTGERMSSTLLVGGALVLVGVYLGIRRKPAA